MHSLEQALRVKEKEVTELKRGVSGTHLREMEVQIEVYCREIRRLVRIYYCILLYDSVL